MNNDYTRELEQRKADRIKNEAALLKMMRGETQDLTLKFSASDLANKTLDAKFDVIYDLMRKIADKFADNEARYPEIFKTKS
jgi:hypothetical protein